MNNELIQQLIAALTALMSLVTGFMADIPQMKDDIASLQGQIDSVEQVESAIGGDTFNFVAGGVYSLSGSGIGLTDTSITLDSFQMPVSGIELTMTDFGDIGYATIEPGKSKKEFISFTGISQNGSNDQATFTGVTRGLNFVAPYTASTTLRQTHSGGAKLVISNPPQLYNKLTAKDNDETITGLWHFNTVIPTFSGAADATSTLQAATRAYVNSVATQGAATSTESVGGLVELATQAEMASSTDLGLDRPLVPYTKYSTSTCTGTGFTFLVTKSDGNISNNCLDTAETIHWLGAFTLSSTTMGRLNASTTITHGTTTTQTFLMASSGGSRKVLTSNSTGVGTWQAGTFSVASSTQSTAGSSAATTTRWRMQIPSGMWGANSMVQIYLTGDAANNAANDQYIIANIGVNGGAKSVTYPMANLEDCDGYSMVITIGARGATNSQIFSGYGNTNSGGSSCQFNGFHATAMGGNAFQTSAIDLSSGIVDVYIETRNQNAGDTLTIESIKGTFTP